MNQVRILTDAVDDITTVDDFLAVSENHILEDVNACVAALQVSTILPKYVKKMSLLKMQTFFSQKILLLHQCKSHRENIVLHFSFTLHFVIKYLDSRIIKY